MQYLYKGDTEELSVEPTDILELMAAANFFQLDGLLQYCEVRCASLIDLDNIVSYYIHAKVRTQTTDKALLTFCFVIVVDGYQTAGAADAQCFTVVNSGGSLGRNSPLMSNYRHCPGLIVLCVVVSH